jgi:hypothetical protein
MSDCQWPGGCTSDGVPEGVPTYDLLNLESRYDGRYCHVHVMKRVRQMAASRATAADEGSE